MRLSLALLFFVLTACHGSHRPIEPGSDAGICGGDPSLICVTDCGGDAGLPPVCTAGRWTCPAGTRELRTCPPSTTCPPDVNPWEPTAPGNACSTEGATCTNGTSDPCGGGVFCTCRSGRWDCLVAEPDPVCWCGRQPSEGDRCNMEGSLCGECCPTPGGTGWPAMQCSSGRWAPAACPDIECPPIAVECPTVTSSVLGLSCPVEGASCGHACCSTAIECTGGVWVRGPEADCARCPEFPCGEGSCTEQQFCASECGPAGGVREVCRPMPSDCASCDCLPLFATQVCEMIDGHPHVRDAGPCI